MLMKSLTSREQLEQTLKLRACQWYSGRSCHPEPHAIEQFVRLWKSVLLPNYFPAPTGSTVMEELYQVLVAQIHRALFARCIDTAATPESRDGARAQADAFLLHAEELQALLHEDVLATYNGDPSASGLDEILLTYPGIFALSVYRVAHVLQDMGVPLLPRMMTEYAHRVTGIDIHPGAVVGKGIMIDHGTGIVIGETAIVGNRVNLYHGVTLGALFFPRDEGGTLVRMTKRHPTIEDDVVLYAHAAVLGGDTVIGQGSVIGSNAFITKSVPAYSKVLYRSDHILKVQESVPQDA
ncbi:MAG: serine O-acetyltransferase [Firmicutes bacterium]|nr:serine O-acetyltransferase [Bacillota bacterium]